MVDAKRLLKDLQRLVKLLEDDLRERVTSVTEMADRLQAEYRSAKDAGRTGESFETWREGVLTQAAVAWILGCVFVRFLEDNGLVDDPLISGPGERRGRASDRQTLYFQSHPTDTDRDYLYDVFRTVEQLPSVARLYDETHNPLWAYGISGDMAKELIIFWRQVVPETGELVHDFRDAEWNTRFLGDLYQDLSDAARKRYALLQTPVFVEEFILDRTLDPAIDQFGLKEVRLIDPTCGSGHFLLGAFRRLLDQWFKKEPGTPERELVQRALDGTYGVDINPYAAAIARFRLIVEALKASSIRRMKEAPGYRINVTAGDSLLHGPRLLTAADSMTRHGMRSAELDLGSGADQLRSQCGIGHAFEAEDLDELNRILGQRYHAVVGNPPYITVKDRALNQLYRDRYPNSCHMKYALTVPFAERFFQLAVPFANNRESAGFIGMITANSFMKREFGRKLIENFFRQVDLTHVIDTSGAYIPGHGTPTVILFGRERTPVDCPVRTVMGIKGEPATPEDAAKGMVWSAIIEQINLPGSESPWVSVADTPRVVFDDHPWSIGGGGASELRIALEQAADIKLNELVESIGVESVTGDDNVFLGDEGLWRRVGIPLVFVLPMVKGEDVRDWTYEKETKALFPYEPDLSPVLNSRAGKFLWNYRTGLEKRLMFKRTQIERGLEWFEFGMFVREKHRTLRSIVFGEVATHNHFVLATGKNTFNQTAPVIKLHFERTADDHLELLGLLNSSTACFWLKQVCHNKGSTVDAHGARQTTDPFENFFQFNSTKVKLFPIPDGRPVVLATKLDQLAQERSVHLPAQLVAALPLSRADLDARRADAESLLRHMIALQEELDWRCYALYGVIDQDLCHPDPPEITLGQRAFEIAMARQMAKGDLETTWFGRHHSKPITELPNHWSEDYKQLVERRIALIESDRYIGLVEQPEYKRRWNLELWEDQEKRVLRGWLLNYFDKERSWPEPRIQSIRAMAERAQTDNDFMKVAEIYVGHPGFDVNALVAELVENESAPFLPVLRYKPSGLRKRMVWEQTWGMQRQKDIIDTQVTAELSRVSGETDEGYQSRLEAEQRKRKKAEVGDIAPPPKYRSTDFLKTACWRLRGPLDVPKERFVSYPHCSRDNDSSLVVGWAGWDHLQQAQALAGYYTEMVEQEGWPVERLKPLLAGLAELLPWLKQWHNDIDPEFNERMGDFFETFLQSELQKHGLTPQDLDAWEPPVTATRRARRRRA